MDNSEFTLEQLINAGYNVPPAPPDAWRSYDEQNPVPNYFDFDWFSSRHPDLYHRFALSTLGLMEELDSLLDLTGLEIIEVGAGTGRASIAAAKKAKKVTAVDIFPAVIAYGREMVRQAGLENVTYLRANCHQLPFPDGSFDLFLDSWAILNFAEGFRVLKPGGLFIWLGPVPGALCGELTALLAGVFPQIITEVAPAGLYDPACPKVDSVLPDSTWNDIPVIAPVLLHDFTYLADYGEPQEAAAILGRLYGPSVKRYMLDRQQAKLAWRLRIALARVDK